MKRILACLYLLLLMMPAFSQTQIRQLIFFGDSLSDNGNVYQLLLRIIPKSPPYYQGRFSNGPTWAEQIGNYYASNYFIDYKIYAYGGATTIFHAPSTRFIAPTNLGLEVSEYLVESLLHDKSNVLYSIWIGANDYMFDTESDIDKLTTQVTHQIEKNIQTLIYYGAKHFLLLNLPDLGRIPFAETNQNAARLHAFVMLHNQKLADIMVQLKQKYPNVSFQFIDIYTLLNDFMDNPQKYNDQYHVAISDTQHACWQGGLWLRRQQQIKAEDLSSLTTKAHYDATTVNALLTGNSELSYAYTMGQLYRRGVVPCENPSQYLFWDDMHPTAVVHQVLSQVVIDSKPLS
jgi:phospholipase/lecithinase/hemolysin